MRNFSDLCGMRFGRLRVQWPAGIDRWHSVYWLCSCECGVLKTIRQNSLKSGNTRSCGCLVKETTSNRAKTHGETVGRKDSPEYVSFHAAKSRCTKKNHKYYYNYGGRGIEFRFTSFAEFLAHIGRKENSNLTLERIDNNGHYELGNVRWATRKEQQQNTRKRQINVRSSDIHGA